MNVYYDDEKKYRENPIFTLKEDDGNVRVLLTTGDISTVTC